MKHLVCACLLIVAAGMNAIAAGQTPAMRKGISVQLAISSKASPVPAADNANAWILAITAEGKMYFGEDLVTPENLAAGLKVHPRDRDTKLYIKADARVSYAEVQKALKVARESGFDAPVMLTAGITPVMAGQTVPPKGLVVMVDPPAGSDVIVLQSAVDRRAQQVRIQNQNVQMSVLPNTLEQLAQGNADKRVILIKASGNLTFAQVVDLIDACYAAGVKVVLAPPEK